MSDGAQSLDVPQFGEMMRDLGPYVDIWKRSRQSDAIAALV
jgi:hypothetical protein